MKTIPRHLSIDLIRSFMPAFLLLVTTVYGDKIFFLMFNKQMYASLWTDVVLGFCIGAFISCVIQLIDLYFKRETHYVKGQYVITVKSKLDIRRLFIFSALYSISYAFLGIAVRNYRSSVETNYMLIALLFLCALFIFEYTDRHYDFPETHYL